MNKVWMEGRRTQVLANEVNMIMGSYRPITTTQLVQDFPFSESSPCSRQKLRR
jgi:hypothetical protein